MAVDSYTYGTETGVEAIVGWVVPARAFTTTSVPTTAQVETMLDQVASRIHAKMAEVGYTIATKSDITSDAPRAINWLIQLNEAGAAAMILQSFATAGDPEDASTPAGYWNKIFEDGLKMISGRWLSDLGLTKGTDLSDLLVGTSVKDTDGYDKKPLFKRTQFDVPSSRQLTSEED